MPIARAYIKAAPERMVWASDWPHPTEKDKPNDAVLFDLLTEWAPDEATRTRILVEIRRRSTVFRARCDRAYALTWVRLAASVR